MNLWSRIKNGNTYTKINFGFMVFLIILALADYFVPEASFLSDYIKGTFTETLGIVITLIFVQFIFEQHETQESKIEEVKKIKRALRVLQVYIDNYRLYANLVITPIQNRNYNKTQIPKSFRFNDMRDLFLPSLIINDGTTPVIYKFLSAYENLTESIESVMLDIDFKFFPELSSLLLEYIAFVSEIDISDSIKLAQGNEKIRNTITTMIKEHEGNVEYLESNLINTYITLYNLIIFTAQFFEKYNEEIKVLDSPASNGRRGGSPMVFDFKWKSKRKVFAVCCCLLVLFSAWFLRWEEVDTKTVEGVKLIYLTDRWTNQNWIRLQGVSDAGKLYSGEEVPYITEEQINAKEKDIISGEMGEKRKQYLQNKKEEIIKKQDKFSEGHTQYIRLYKHYENEFNTSIIKNLPISKNDPFYERDVLSEKQSYIWDSISEETRKANKAWKAYKNQIISLDKQMKDMSDWATVQAEKTLKAEAYTTRKIATYIWYSLLGIVFLVVGIKTLIHRKRTNVEELTGESNAELIE